MMKKDGEEQTDNVALPFLEPKQWLHSEVHWKMVLLYGVIHLLEEELQSLCEWEIIEDTTLMLSAHWEIS